MLILDKTNCNVEFRLNGILMRCIVVNVDDMKHGLLLDCGCCSLTLLGLKIYKNNVECCMFG